jgi:hypothetical protein
VTKYPYIPSSLDLLSKACQKATFGQGDKDVLDETYRKAGKLDFGKFAWNKRLDEFDGNIKNILLPFEGNGKGVRCELYKLNVYGWCSHVFLISHSLGGSGKGSFFKSHKDTPRADTMFGSLVFILPAPHTGGELVLKHNSDELIVDAASMLKDCTNSVAYVAFYSDVDHEVREVIDGHRVTITYNLYTFDIPGELPSYPTTRTHLQDHDGEDTPASYFSCYRTDDLAIETTSIHFQVAAPSAIHSTPFHKLLTSLVADPAFLPKGGLLGFSLQHLYPLPNPKSSGQSNYTAFPFAPQLKGVDAITAHACSSLGLNAALRIVYSTSDGVLLTRTIAEFGELYETDRFSMLVPSTDELEKDKKWKDSKVSISYMPERVWRGRQLYREYVKPVHWISIPASTTRHDQSVITYGNEAELGLVYSHFALIVGVGPVGKRAEYGPIPPELDE